MNTPRFLIVVAALSILPRATFAQTSIVGVWELESIVDTTDYGQPPQWMGAHPTGLIVYAENGQMSVQIMRDPRPTISPAYPWTPDGQKLLATVADADVRDAFVGYYGYFGTYEVDQVTQTVVHHLRGSLRPNEVGQSYTRRFELSGDTLALIVTYPRRRPK